MHEHRVGFTSSVRKTSESDSPAPLVSSDQLQQGPLINSSSLLISWSWFLLLSTNNSDC